MSLWIVPVEVTHPSLSLFLSYMSCTRRLNPKYTTVYPLLPYPYPFPPIRPRPLPSSPLTSWCVVDTISFLSL